MKAFEPVRMLEIELSEPLPSIAAVHPDTDRRYRRVLALVRLHSQPLGLVELPLPDHGLNAAELSGRIWDELGDAIQGHLRQDGLSPLQRLSEEGVPAPQEPGCLRARRRLLAGAPMVSVIVATHNRPHRLAACLQSLLAMDYPRFEIIVVDNAPGTKEAEEMVRRSFPSVRYCREDCLGASCARNRGLREARGEIVAFTDDDVIVDRQWLTALVQGFGRANDVACVTGLVLPSELETPAQLWFEQYGGFGKGFAPRIFDPAARHNAHPLFPYNAGAFGTGGNMAFKTAVLRQLGGFDPALGPATPAASGEELAVFFAVIMAGYQLVYEPAALLRHPHAREYALLRKQVYGYGVGLTAYLTKCLLDHPRLVADFARKIPYGLFFTLSPRSPKNAKKRADYPADLTAVERKGMLVGPWAYLCGRFQLRRQSGLSEERGVGVSSVSSLDGVRS